MGPDGRGAILTHFARADDHRDGLTIDGKFISDFDLTHAEVRADAQANYLPYKDGDFLSFNPEYGPVYIPWKYVVRREVVDAETGDILDLDKQVGTRSRAFLSRPTPSVRNVITKFWWYRDKYSVEQKSNEREFIWTTKSSKFVTSPEDKELPCKWEDVARITTYDNDGNVLRDLFYP